LVKHGRLPQAEAYQVFNMGIGMTAFVAPDHAAAALRFIRARAHAAWVIGHVARGRHRVLLGA
jgi:phosphoribosylaminoimidazole (AIR) synthetase